ncbi:TPA: HAD-IIB family hydrolase [Klebsiella variicola subsp. variicola]|nr:HAD-IIB family hydrolase [Klebsiella variicola]
MNLIDNVTNEDLQNIRFVLTDMDETLTYKGRLQARTYQSLEMLQHAGIKVIPVTAASAGWADQMARMWPVDWVIAENGGLFLTRNNIEHGINRYFWHEDKYLLNREKISHILLKIRQKYPWVEVSDDQDFRLTSIAFKLPKNHEQTRQLIDELAENKCSYTINNLWVLGWLGGYDKLVMSRKVLKHFYALEESDEQASVFYSGDSLNDAPMFSYYSKTLGMNTINDIAQVIPSLPRWISQFPGGEGFVDGANRILNAKRASIR